MKIKMNLPNKLTILRIVLTPIFLFVFFADFIPFNHFYALAIFIIAAITDFADGNIARKRNLITNFGKIADPIADKILTTAVLLGFMMKNLCSIWIFRGREKTGIRRKNSKKSKKISKKGLRKSEK